MNNANSEIGGIGENSVIGERHVNNVIAEVARLYCFVYHRWQALNKLACLGKFFLILLYPVLGMCVLNQVVNFHQE